MLTQRNQITRFELKDNRRLCFYAALFNVEAPVADVLPDGNIRRYREQIAPGAFSASLAARHRIAFNLEHDPSRTFAYFPDDGLLQEDGKGLFASCWLPDTPLGNDVKRRCEAGEQFGCSFYGQVDSVPAEGGSIRRTGFTLQDVCLTVIPAYPQTKGSVVLRHAPLNLNAIRARYAYAKMLLR